MKNPAPALPLLLILLLPFLAATSPAGERQTLRPPLISPRGGEYTLNEPVTVHIRSRPNTTLIYTLDGSIPTPGHGIRADHNAATFPLPPGDTTIRAIAVRKGFDPSPIAAAKFVRSGN